MKNLGQWDTLSFQIPEQFQDTRESINDVAEFLVTALDIALSALQIVKAYAIGYLDPLTAIVQAIIDEIEALLADLDQLGVYITGDWALLEHPYEALQGGFSEYERRMIARLTDTTDPTRPDVSPATEVFAAFFYSSVDFTSIAKLVQFVRQLLDLFSQQIPPSGTPPIPYVTRVEYSSGFAFSSLETHLRLDANAADRLRVFWRVSPTGEQRYLPPISPQGFLVTVSTREEGIPLFYSRDGSNVGEDTRREEGRALDRFGRPVTLYGGADMLGPLGNHDWNDTVDGDSFQPGTITVYGTKAEGVIPLSELKKDGVYYFQRTFVVPVEQISSWAREEFSVSIPYSQLPHVARCVPQADGTITIEDLGLSSTYYIRVASAEDRDAVLSTQAGDGTGGYQWDISRVSSLVSGERFRLARREAQNHSAWSVAYKAPIPNVHSSDVFDALCVSLLVLVLSRSDLPVIDDLQGLTNEEVELAKAHQLLVPGVALQRTGLEEHRSLIGRITADLPSKGPLEYRKALWQAVRSVAQDLLASFDGRADLLEYIVQNTLELRRVGLEDILSGEALRAYQTLSVSYGHETARFTLSDAFRLGGDTESREREQELNELAMVLGDDPLFPDLADEPSPYPGAWPELGFAKSPYGIGVGEEVVDGIGLTGRKDDFIETGDSGWEVLSYIPPSQTLEAIEQAPQGLRMFYEKYVQTDGSIQIPTEVMSYVQALEGQDHTVGSADDSPVFYFDIEKIRTAAAAREPNSNVQFARTLLRSYQDGLLYSQAALVLQIAHAARPDVDGEWIAIRLLDTLPGLGSLFDDLTGWLGALSDSLQGIADAILRYIAFVEERIIELQNLIRRINGLIQGLLAFTIDLPEGSVLLVSGRGTQGVLQKLVTAEDKPLDGVQAYGGGVAMLAPTAPAFLIDLLRSEGGSGSSDLFGREGLPAAPDIDANAEPDVL